MANREVLSTKIVHLGIISFWFLFWLLSVIDKFIFEPVFLWVGKDFFAEFIELFSSIGVDSVLIVGGFYWFVVALEFIALIFLFLSLLNYCFKKYKKADKFFFSGTIIGLVIFTFFTIGDQVFGEREELMEHTVFWLALIISWAAYTYFPTTKKDSLIEN